jgi:hypothetical protein
MPNILAGILAATKRIYFWNRNACRSSHSRTEFAICENTIQNIDSWSHLGYSLLLFSDLNDTKDVQSAIAYYHRVELIMLLIFTFRFSELRLTVHTYSDGKLPEIFTGGNFPYYVRDSFLFAYFYHNIYVSGYFYRIIYVFIVLSMLREIFRKLRKFLSLSIPHCSSFNGCELWVPGRLRLSEWLTGRGSVECDSYYLMHTCTFSILLFTQ